MWTLTAWAVVALHLGYLGFQMLGGLLALVSRGWLTLHLAAVTWGIGIVAVQGSCPLTRLEKHLIEQGGTVAYPESFLDHYVFGAVLPDGSQALVYAGHLLVILATYLFVVPRLRRPARPSGAGWAGGAASPGGGA